MSNYDYEIKTMLDYLKSLAGKRKDIKFFISPFIGSEDKVILGFTDFAFDITIIDVDKNYLKDVVEDICLLSSVDDIKNFKNYVVNNSEYTIKLGFLKELIYKSIFCNKETKNIPFFITGEDLKNLNNFIKTKNTSLNGFQSLEFVENKEDKRLILNAVYKDLLNSDVYKCEVLRTQYSYKDYDILNKKNIRIDRLNKEFKGSSLYIDYMKDHGRDVVIFSEFYKYGIVKRISLFNDVSLYKNDYLDFNVNDYNIDDYIAFIKMCSLQNIDNKIITEFMFNLKNNYKEKYILSIVTDDNKEAYIKVCDNKDDIKHYITYYTGGMEINIEDLNYDGYTEIDNYYFITIKTLKEGF